LPSAEAETKAYCQTAMCNRNPPPPMTFRLNTHRNMGDGGQFSLNMNLGWNCFVARRNDSERETSVEYCTKLRHCGGILSEWAALDAFAALCLRDLSTAYLNDIFAPAIFRARGRGRELVISRECRQFILPRHIVTSMPLSMPLHCIDSKEIPWQSLHFH
jgi:hypothetical protein